MNDHPLVSERWDTALRSLMVGWGEDAVPVAALRELMAEEDRLSTLLIEAEAERAVLLARAEHAESRLRDVYGCTDDTPCASCRGEALAGTAAPSEDAGKCARCHGEGWYADHEAECYEDGDCSCSGVQVQCDCGAGAVPVERTDVASHPHMDAEWLAREHDEECDCDPTAYMDHNVVGGGKLRVYAIHPNCPIHGAGAAPAEEDER